MALLERVLQRGPDRKEPGGPLEPEEDGGRMTVIEHLEALRRVLIISIVAWTLATVVAFVFWQPIFEFLIHRAGIPKVYYPHPTGAALLGFKVALYVGFVGASPVLIQQVWWFVSPGLHRRERRLILPLILATAFFFLVGVGFALFSVPLVLKVLNRFAPPDVVFFPFGDEFLSFMLAIVIGFGLIFELPVILYVLGMMGIISSRWLWKNRLYWIIGLGVISQVLTPGVDPFTPLIMFVPLLIFWGGTTLLLRLTGR